MEKLLSIIINLAYSVIALLMMATMIGLALIAAGFVWNGVLLIWGMIL